MFHRNEKYKDSVTGEVKFYEQWIDDVINVFVDEGLDCDRALIEAISIVANMIRDGELELIY